MVDGMGKCCSVIVGSVVSADEIVVDSIDWKDIGICTFINIRADLNFSDTITSIIFGEF